MQTEPTISFHNMDKSEVDEEHIRAKIHDLDTIHPRIVGCRVVVDAPHRHGHKGRLYEVRIDVALPGKDISVSRDTGHDHAHEDINVAIYDAFVVAKRLLEDRMQLMSAHRHKAHPEAIHGRVDRIFAEEGFGFIEAENGEEVYFQQDSLTKSAWPKIKPGTRVRFKIKSGDKGLFAIHVNAET